MLEAIGNTPLVRLQRLARGRRHEVWVKCEHLNPSGSVKDRIAKAIVLEALAPGRLRPGMTIVEATAGNTGLGLALVTAALDHPLVCVMPEKMSVDKRQALRAVGAQVVITPNAPPSDPRNFQRHAERLAEQRGWFLTDQFRNPANPAAHEATTGLLARASRTGSPPARSARTTAMSRRTRPSSVAQTESSASGGRSR